MVEKRITSGAHEKRTLEYPTKELAHLKPDKKIGIKTWLEKHAKGLLWWHEWHTYR